MIADYAFAIGATHAVCQDYACATPGDAWASAWLSDGCSSSPDTDCGARLLARAARMREAGLFASAPPDVLGSWATDVARTAGRTAQALGLSPTSLDASLLGVVADRARGMFRVLIYGDGVAVLGRSNGKQEIFHIAYTHNLPLYLSYRNDEKRAAQWERETMNRCEIEVTGTSDSGVAMSSGAFVLERPLSDYQFAAVFSDGLESFTRPDAQDDTARVACGYREVLAELTAIKGWRGEWVKRRFGRFQRDAHRWGWQHADDLSVAGVYFGE